MQFTMVCHYYIKREGYSDSCTKQSNNAGTTKPNQLSLVTVYRISGQ